MKTANHPGRLPEYDRQSPSKCRFFPPSRQFFPPWRCTSHARQERSATHHFPKSRIRCASHAALATSHPAGFCRCRLFAPVRCTNPRGIAHQPCEAPAETYLTPANVPAGVHALPPAPRRSVRPRFFKPPVCILLWPLPHGWGRWVQAKALGLGLPWRGPAGHPLVLGGTKRPDDAASHPEWHCGFKRLRASRAPWPVACKTPLRMGAHRRGFAEEAIRCNAFADIATVDHETRR